MHTVLIGGGVIGLSCAYYLRKAGIEVTVIDRSDLSDGCSFGNMGYVSPSHFVPLATPGIIAQGLKWMMSSTSPFYIKPRLNLDLLNWGLTFWKKATAKNVAYNAPHLNNLLQLSRALIKDLSGEIPQKFELVERGVFMLWKSQKTGEHEKQMAEQASLFGLKTITCSQQEVQQYEPEVEVSAGGGILYLDDCHLNPRQLMQRLYGSLQNSGVKFLLNTSVQGFEKRGNKITGILTTGGRISCDEVVLCNGSWLGVTSKLLGIQILMQPGKGYSLSYDNLQQNLHYPSILVDERTATTPIDSWLRIGGTMELSGHSNNILPKRVDSIRAAFKKYYPGVSLPRDHTSKPWFGYRPVTPDGMPYIGRYSKYENLTYAGGHAMLGVSAATGTGKLIAEIIQHHTTTIDIAAFSPERFR